MDFSNIGQRQIFVEYLIREDGVPSAEWVVDRTETMSYAAYLKMSASALANTRPRFVEEKK